MLRIFTQILQEPAVLRWGLAGVGGVLLEDVLVEILVAIVDQ